VTAPTFFATTDALTTNLYRLFGNLEWHMQPALIANVGAMLEKNDITGSNISPRLALNYHLDDRQTLRATVSKATRTPTLFEDQANYKLTVGPITDLYFLSKGILESERIMSRDIGYLFNWPERGTALDIRIYHDSLSKLIRADYICSSDDIACLAKVLGSGLDNVCLEPGTNRCYNYQIQKNIDAAAVRGLEMHLDQRIGSATRVIVGYAYTKISDNDFRNRLERSAPTNNIHLFLIQKLPADTQASLAYYQTGRMEYLGSGNSTPLQRRLDLRLAHTIKRASDRLTVAVVAQNLLNDYPDFLNHSDVRNLFDTRAFIQIAWEMP
jgi:iron complex outermembrane receptor protein